MTRKEGERRRSRRWGESSQVGLRGSFGKLNTLLLEESSELSGIPSREISCEEGREGKVSEKRRKGEGRSESKR